MPASERREPGKRRASRHEARRYGATSLGRFQQLAHGRDGHAIRIGLDAAALTAGDSTFGQRRGLLRRLRRYTFGCHVRPPGKVVASDSRTPAREQGRIRRSQILGSILLRELGDLLQQAEVARHCNLRHLPLEQGVQRGNV
jgi:hypothetical protein